MCERCVEQAAINQANAEAISSLANAAMALATSVPGSEGAVKAIVARIESIGELPEPEKAKAQAPKADAKDEVPAELRAFEKLLASMGIEAEFVKREL